MASKKQAAWEFYQTERARISRELADRRRRASEAYADAMRAAKVALDAENADASEASMTEMRALQAKCRTMRATPVARVRSIVAEPERVAEPESVSFAPETGAVSSVVAHDGELTIDLNA